MEHLIAGIGLALMLGLAGAGSAIGLATGGAAVLGMIQKKPEAFGVGLVLSGLPATQGLYGFVGFILFSSEMNADLTALKAGTILAAGIALGIAGFFSAVHQGKVCANGINAIGNGVDAFGRTMILAAFPEFYAILALTGSILLSQ
ncbi:ATPase [Leptospira sp. GIMC2001]|uniref:ATPase n=1 Tax=Leptospira sp. GIMC2001 TaxID=1513297 RepID=UPI00234ADC42|nr:ATPase [Leptospira sp. GIMC2001]WCL49073.1 ATPase [Leptospira sp. GIMC2001]